MEFLLSLEDKKLQQDSFTGFSEDANAQFNELHQYPAVLGLYKYIRDYGTSPCVSTPRKLMVSKKIAGNAPIFSSLQLKAHYHLQKGIYCRYIGHKEGAEYNLEKALNLYDEQHHAIGAFRALYQLFGLHCIVDVEKANQYNDELQARLSQIQDPYSLMLYYQLQGDTLEHKNDWTGAFLAYQKSLNLLNSIPNIKIAMRKYFFLKSCLDKLEGAIDWCQAKLPDSDLSHFNKKYLSGSAISIAVQIHQNHIDAQIEDFFQRIGNYRAEDKVYFLLKTLSCWLYTKSTQKTQKYKEKLAYCMIHTSLDELPVPIKALWLEYQANERKFKEGDVTHRNELLNKAIVLYQDNGLLEDAFRCQLAVMESHLWLKLYRQDDFSYSALELTKVAIDKTLPLIAEVDSQIHYHYLMGSYYLDNQNFDLALIHLDQFDLKCTADLRHVIKYKDYEKMLQKNRQICREHLQQLLQPWEQEVSGLNLQRQADSGEYCLQSDKNPKLELYQFSTHLNRARTPAGMDSRELVQSDEDSLWREFDKNLKLTY